MYVIIVILVFLGKNFKYRQYRRIKRLWINLVKLHFLFIWNLTCRNILKNYTYNQYKYLKHNDNKEHHKI